MKTQAKHKQDIGKLPMTQNKTMRTNWEKEFDEKFYYSEDAWLFMIDKHGVHHSATLNDVKKFIEKTLHSHTEELIKKVEGMKVKIELVQPRLFQTNPERNQFGGYSSYPFYCSLCGMDEMKIQDNKIGKNYHCHCSVWDSPTGGKWIKWHNKDIAIKLVTDYPSGDNFYNQALQDIIKLFEGEYKILSNI